MVMVSTPLPAPAVGAADQRIREDGPEVDERHQVAGPFRTEAQVGAQVRQDLAERDEIIALEEGRDAQEHEQPPLVGREGVGHRGAQEVYPRLKFEPAVARCGEIPFQ
jgi:hypothetical protein